MTQTVLRHSSRRANLQGANLYGANFARAVLRGANLARADISGIKLRGSDLYGANLSDVDFLGVDFSGTTDFVELMRFQIRSSANWERAFYSPEILESLGLPPDHNESLQKELEESSQ